MSLRTSLRTAFLGTSVLAGSAAIPTQVEAQGKAPAVRLAHNPPILFADIDFIGSLSAISLLTMAGGGMVLALFLVTILSIKGKRLSKNAEQGLDLMLDNAFKDLDRKLPGQFRELKELREAIDKDINSANYQAGLEKFTAFIKANLSPEQLAEIQAGIKSLNP